jgi:hypothetical protein
VEYFRAEPSLLGIIDSYGIELLHPIREGYYNACAIGQAEGLLL